MTNGADNGFSTNRCREWRMEATAAVYPGSWSGTFFRSNDECRGSLAHSKAVQGHFRTNRSCRLVPAHQGMKSRSCGLVQRMARRILPRPDPTPAGDKPPRYIFSFRHRPSVYNRHAGLEPAHEGMKMRGRWRCLGVVGATHPLWIPAFAGMTNWGAGNPSPLDSRPDDEIAEWRGSTARSKAA